MRRTVKVVFLVWSLLSGIVTYASEASAHSAAALQTRIPLEVEGLRLLDKTALYDALDADYPSRFAFWKKKKATVKVATLSTIDETLRAFLDSEGFYDATYRVEHTKDKVIVYIEEHDPVRIDDINLSGDFNLSEIVRLKRGAVFRAEDFIQTKSDIVDALLNEGYCSYDLFSKAYVDLERKTVDVVFRVEKGDVCTFGEMSVKGLRTIDPIVVRSRVRAQKGDRFSLEAVKDTSSALYGLQAFDSVRIDVSRKLYNVIPVDIEVTEMQKPYHIELGAGYDTYAGPRLHARFVKHNFLGNAKLLTLRASWSSQEKLLIGDFFKPVLFAPYGWWLDYGISTGYSDLEFDGFREKKYFFKNYLSHENRHLKLTLGLAAESIEISHLEEGRDLLPPYAYDTFFLVYPYAEAIYDTRDSKLNPKNGYYLSAYAEYGLPTDPDASLYFKWLVEGRAIHTFSALTTAVVAKIGTITIFDDSVRGIPESKKFFGGGSFSNRAYGYDEIGVVTSETSDLVNGALSMVNLSLEADYPIRGKLYGAVFCDNTMLNAESYDFGGKVITSAGVGVRYMTPVGPFKLDVAFNIHDTSQYGIVFQIGQSF